MCRYRRSTVRRRTTSGSRSPYFYACDGVWNQITSRTRSRPEFISQGRVRGMKRSYALSSFLTLGAIVVAGALLLPRAHAQGLAGTAEQKAKQLAIEKAAPQLAINEEV